MWLLPGCPNGVGSQKEWWQLNSLMLTFWTFPVSFRPTVSAFYWNNQSLLPSWAMSARVVLPSIPYRDVPPSGWSFSDHRLRTRVSVSEKKNFDHSLVWVSGQIEKQISSTRVTSDFSNANTFHLFSHTHDVDITHPLLPRYAGRWALVPSPILRKTDERAWDRIYWQLASGSRPKNIKQYGDVWMSTCPASNRRFGEYYDILRRNPPGDLDKIPYSLLGNCLRRQHRLEREREHGFKRDGFKSISLVWFYADISRWGESF